jgi:type III restriction enzyme
MIRAHSRLRGRLALVKHLLREKVLGLVQEETDRQTEQIFRGMYEADRIFFYLDCVECRFEIPPKVEVRALPKMLDEDREPLQRTLFNFVPEEMNPYERSIALYLDKKPEVLWWYRNLVGPETFAIQGYRRNRIFPDFVVQTAAAENKPGKTVLVVESKGKHLKGSEDTWYKRTVADYFTKAGKRVSWQKLSSGFADRTFRFQVLDQDDYPGAQWREELQKLLDEP